MLRARANSIRVLLIDDHVVMRVGLRMLIESQPGLTVVGEATNRAEAIQCVAREQPDIILLDLDLGGESGLDLIPALRTTAGEARVIVLTGILDSREHLQAIHLGALGLVMKDQLVEVLVKAIEKVHAGQTWLDPALAASVLAERSQGRGQDSDEAKRIATLTERERAVIALICEGLKNKQIARRLFISEITVVHHLTSIFNKLGVANRLELLTYAYNHGLVQASR